MNKFLVTSAFSIFSTLAFAAETDFITCFETATYETCNFEDDIAECDATHGIEARYTNLGKLQKCLDEVTNREQDCQFDELQNCYEL